MKQFEGQFSSTEGGTYLLQNEWAGGFHRLRHLQRAGRNCKLLSAFAQAAGLRLLAYADAERLHLAVEMAALKAEQLRGAAHVVARLFDFLEDVLALVGVARLLQR